MSNHKEKAIQLFENGYNCAQSVFVAFCDITGLDEKTAASLSSSFGAGMGRMREVCGAISGMFMAAGILYGYSDPKANNEKAEHYARIQSLARDFKEINGSIICHELLKGLECSTDPNTPSPRTEEFYKKRPCKAIIGEAAEILDRYIEKHPLKQ